MIDRLEMFMALARERHFGRAAESLNISQPTLSSAIKQLEEQLGVRLVQRGARFMGLTPEGERALEWAKRIVGDHRAMAAEMRALRSGLTGKVRIAVIPTALGMVQNLTAAFLAAHPDVTVSIVSRTSEEIRDAIANFGAELGITYLDNEPVGEVTTVPLYRERYRFVTADPALFAGRQSVAWAETGGIPLCLLTPDMQNRRIVNQYMLIGGATPLAPVETNSVIVMAAHILTGRWSGIMAEKMVGMFAHEGRMRAIPLVDPQGTQIVGAIAPKREPHMPAVGALLRHVRALSEIGPKDGS